MKKINYFPTNLRFLLKKNGYSQASFGAEIGKDRTTVGIWVKGSSQPDQGITIQIANIFKVGLDDLLLKDLTSEKYSHIENTAHSIAEEQEDYVGEGLDEPITILIKKVVALAVRDLTNDVKELKQWAKEDKETKQQINYIYNALQKAELAKEIKQTIDKIKDA